MKMKTIWKFAVPLQDQFSIPLPEKAEVLTVQTQHGRPQFWAVVSPTAKTEDRTFYLAGTGHKLPDVPMRFVGSFQLHNEALIFHLFEAL